MRVPGGHGGSQTFLTHEFISSIVEDPWPTVNVYEAIAYTLPGITAHRSALHDGEPMKIRDYGSRLDRLVGQELERRTGRAKDFV